MLSEKTEEEPQPETYGSRFFKESVPKLTLPSKSMPANAAYQMIHDELNLDANPALNLASFVTTWMEPEAIQLIEENLHKNFIDHDEYPQTEKIQTRCVNMLARLYHAPDDAQTMGTATVGSSEAIMLGLLGHKWAWRKKRQAAGQPYDKPNVIFGGHAHICWEKFAKYFDVEMRLVPVEEHRYTLRTEKVAELIDENTIAVGAILGSTYTGEVDPIRELNSLLVTIKREKGWDIPLHIDAASGGFILPFTEPKFVWDFRLEQVKSINVSGHKFGLVYPGVGWILWREKEDFPEELIYKVDYLGGWMPTYTLNFSRGSGGVIGQYYNFLRLGKEGYSEIMNNCLANARYLSAQFKKLERFTVLNRGEQLPIVIIRLDPAITDYTVFDISDKVREKGWILSAYTLPKNAEDVAVLRVVVRENFSHDMADMLYEHVREACLILEGEKRPQKYTKPAIC
ncbi:MAG: Glutamate decarboxylase [Chlamydiales bacterium]|nr:Glutamate decarboxylase [Chlamydiales bacterium]